MKYIDKTCTDFIEILSTKAAVPGGGAASALVGGVGTALGSMVGNLTVGKKKYADVETDVIALIAEATLLQNKLLKLVDDDIAAFEPLSKAYGIPKDDPDRAQIMEEALRIATSTPLDIMRACANAIELQDGFAKKGNVFAISDAGVGVLCCKAALQGASLNVFINTKSMTDREYADGVDAEADALLKKYCALADEIYASIAMRLRGGS